MLQNTRLLSSQIWQKSCLYLVISTTSTEIMKGCHPDCGWTQFYCFKHGIREPNRFKRNNDRNLGQNLLSRWFLYILWFLWLHVGRSLVVGMYKCLYSWTGPLLLFLSRAGFSLTRASLSPRFCAGS